MHILLFVLTLTASNSSRFLAEYPDASLHLKKDFANASGIARVHRSSGGKSGPVTTIPFATIDGCAKCEVISKVTRSTKSSEIINMVFAREQDRIFMLNKRGSESQYVITALGNDPATAGVFAKVFDGYLTAPWAMMASDINQLLGSGKLRISDEHEFQDSGRSLVEVSFEIVNSGKEPDLYRIAFDPGLHWAIVRSEIYPAVMGGRKGEAFEVQYAPTATGQVYTKSVRLTEVNGTEVDCEFDQLTLTPTPRSAFTLEYYGLVDPEHKPTSRTSLVAWLGLAVLAVSLFFLGRGLWRRSSIHPAAS